MLHKHYFVINTVSQTITIEVEASSWATAELYATNTKEILEEGGAGITDFYRDYELSHVPSPGHEPGTLYDCPGCVEELGEHDLVVGLAVGVMVRVIDHFDGKIEMAHAGQWFIRASDTGELTGPWDADDLRKI